MQAIGRHPSGCLMAPRRLMSLRDSHRSTLRALETTMPSMANHSWRTNMHAVLGRLFNRLTDAGGDAFWKALPWIFFGAGFVVLAVAYLLLDPVEHSALRGLSITLGTTMLSAGVFAAVLKSFQYIRIFQDELLKSFQTPEFTQALSAVVRPTSKNFVELQGFVQPLVARYVSERFHDLGSHTADQMRRMLVYFDANAFNRSFQRTLHIRSYDSKTHELIVDDDAITEMIPLSKDSVARYFSSLTSDGSTFSHGSLHVNNVDYSQSIQVKGSTILCDLPLSGESIYRIRRTYRKTINVVADPYISHRMSKLTLDLNVQIENHVPHQISLVVLGAGFDSADKSLRFEVATKNPTTQIAVTRVSKRSLTLPDQGYFIVFGVK